MNKQDLIKKIKDLTDISNDEKAYLIELVNTKKKYGLVWEDKPEDVEEQLRSMLPVFKEVKERAIISDEENAPNHILIEGDNLHALTALSYTHEGKVDVIYIDPPYNTGNKDFIYNDAYVDKEDTYRHSKWLSFMDKRLRLAKKLLSEKGVIFISIDDNEQAQLKLLCDEILGSNNFLGSIIQDKQNAKNDSKNIQKNHEYIHVYKNSLNSDTVILKQVELNRSEVFKNEYGYFKIKDSITTRGDGGTLIKRKNLGNTIYYNPITKDKIAVCDYNIDLIKKNIELEDIYIDDDNLISKGYVPIRPPKVRGELGVWTWSLDKINSEKKCLIVTGSNNRYQVKKIEYVDEKYVEERDSKFYFSENKISNSRSIIQYSTNNGSEILNSILGYDIIFNNPKNIDMIKYFLGLKDNNSIILDFFAGSGTTLHATMELNAEDGGNRQCILVTNNENKIAEEVTYERNKRVIQGYINAKGEQVEGLTNNNLRYYQADFVPSERTEMNRRLLTARSTELLCIKENCFIDKTKDFGINEKQAKIFSNGLGKYMVVVYHTRNQEEVIEQLSNVISGLETSEKVKVYAFSPEKEIIEDDFYRVADKITAVPLPDSIYNAYRATFCTLKLDKKEAVSSTTNQEA
ncbi:MULTISPECIES: site-specific DNA-methyltransferase [Empedobacter]|uniref:site-specific DNA-methyltransferase n=1 Tax=Empedobacter TaxID=59734 RepID=UPI002575FC15|nr:MULTISPECIES: site-specific DNA-methyltransferase [Empedobacter]MDM1042820.1 site-specific DNA-methyltransferase [Empedobacter brevis]MDM1136750.1 site-specific DNA-methyltransferase [Empedobacter sp. R750]